MVQYRKIHRLWELILDLIGTGGVSLYGDIKTKYKDMGAVSSVNTNYMILEDIFKNIEFDIF